jgi:anti-sigma-K factor RskA
MNYDRPDLLERLASEYVLGTLGGRARRRFERRPTAGRARRRRGWEARLNALGRAVPGPPRHRSRVWDAIAARTTPAHAHPRRAVGLAEAGAGIRFGAALTLGLVQLSPMPSCRSTAAQKEQALPQSYVGLLTDAKNVPHVLVSSTRHGTRVTVKSLRPWQVPAGKVAQVWALPRDADGRDLQPVPLGIAAPATPPGSTHFELSASSEQLLANVPRLAVRDRRRAGRTPSTFVFTGLRKLRSAGIFSHGPSEWRPPRKW